MPFITSIIKLFLYSLYNIIAYSYIIENRILYKIKDYNKNFARIANMRYYIIEVYSSNKALAKAKYKVLKPRVYS
jgi:hypothetical protein